MSKVPGSYELLKLFTPSYLRFMQSTTVRADCSSAVASARHQKPTKQDIQAHNGVVVQAWDDRTTLTGNTQGDQLQNLVFPRALPLFIRGISTAAGIIRCKHNLSKEKEVS